MANTPRGWIIKVRQSREVRFKELARFQLVDARGDEDPDSRGRTGKGGPVTLLRLTYVAVVPVGRTLRTVPEAIEKYAGG